MSKSKAKAAKGRQKGSKGKVKKKRAVTDAADDHLDGEGQGDIEQEEEHNEMGENIDIDTEDEAEAAYMDPGHAILDNDDDAIETAAGSLGVDVADNPAAFAANEIRIAHDHDAIAKAGLFPTSEEIMQEAEVLAASAHTAGTPEAELQEEALISIIRARSAGKRFPTHAASAAAATTTAMDDSGESTADEADRPVVMESMPAEQTGVLDADATAIVFNKWSRSALKMLQAMKQFAISKTYRLGHERSISLILQKPMTTPVPNCKCVRCKWQDESNDLIWVHWLNNHPRQDCLDRWRECDMCR